MPSNRSVLTPVIKATNSITAYSARFAAMFDTRVFAKSVMLFLLPVATSNLYSTATSLRPGARFNNSSLVAHPEPR